jgi:hypothetical protein
MSESTDIIPFYANPKIVIPVVVIAIAAAVGIPMLLKYMAGIKAKVLTNDELATQAKTAKDVATKYGLDQGRMDILTNNAQQIYDAIYNISSFSVIDRVACITALNQATSSVEMGAMSDFYRNQVSKGLHGLLEDVNSQILGSRVWPHDASEITFFTSIT